MWTSTFTHKGRHGSEKQVVKDATTISGVIKVNELRQPDSLSVKDLSKGSSIPMTILPPPPLPTLRQKEGKDLLVKIHYPLYPSSIASTSVLRVGANETVGDVI